MAYIVHTNTCTPAPSRARAPRGVLSTFLSLLQLNKSRKDLAALDPHLLKDIGLTENEANTEAQRSVWDVPSNWRL